MSIFNRIAVAAREGRLVSGLVKTGLAFSRDPVPFFREPFYDWVAPFTRESSYRRELGRSQDKCPTLPCISTVGDFSLLPEATLVKESLDRALDNIGGPPDFIRAIEGMSGQKYRTFISNLIRSYPDARYLEIGSWGGSTATAALYGNSVRALCIDNWSQFGGPRETFFANIERIRSDKIDFQFIEADFRSVDYESIGRFNVFLFDGPHEERDQYDGVMVTRPALQKPFVLIVDDWNLRQVRLGTFHAIIDAGYSLACSVEIRTTWDNTQPSIIGRDSDWHNGYFIAVIK